MIGGNIVCNVGGMYGGCYGVMWDFVLVLKGFLLIGEYVEWGMLMKKFFVGFNLCDLWIGSEGMFGVIIEVMLKLILLLLVCWMLLVLFVDEIDVFCVVKVFFV